MAERDRRNTASGGYPRFEVAGYEEIRPDDAGSADIYSRFNYSLSEAVADLVDNSIDAGASNVLVRLVRSDEKILRVLIIDDGRGVSAEKISTAMRVGSSVGKTNASLGKYGIGLKSASLNQANSVTFLSLSTRGASGRRWTLANIKRGWQCEVLDAGQVGAFLKRSFGPVVLSRSGAAVVWEELQHLSTSAATIEATIAGSFKALTKDLGLRFHRFIADGRLTIHLDTQYPNSEESSVHLVVPALDPFSYPVSGHAGYPKTFVIDLPPFGVLKAIAHIWPPKSGEPGYKLGGGRVSSRQGFYIYRNGRLIQAGGWNGCREDDNEPHLSLGRVVIDLPPAFDATFQLGVTKSKVVPPPDFAPRVLACHATDGTPFRKFIDDAQQAYRQQKKKDSAAFKIAPGKGVSAAAREAAKRAMWQKGAAPLTPVQFAWRRLDPDIFVDVDRENHAIVLNTLYRKDVLRGESPSATDAALVKMLLMFMLHDQLDRRAMTDKYLDWFQRMNHALVAVCNKAK